MATTPLLLPSIDLYGPGKRIGHLDLSWSDDRHAYGVIPVPIAVISGGSGPTALVTAGVHGDEYEGLVIARRLIRELDPGQMNGRLIVMPAANLPAVRARSRISPIDRQNMNRAFPGDDGLGPTALIAHFIEKCLIPEMDLVLDLHSGGTQSIYDPCGYVYEMGDAEFRARKLAACHAFGAPLTAAVATTSSSGSLSAACERARVTMIATELGGGAKLDLCALEIGWRGTLNLLRHSGVLQGIPEKTVTRLVRTPSRECFVMASIDGMFESYVSPGMIVEAGAPAGRIWPMDDLSREPVEAQFTVTGTVLCCRTMPMVTRGDTLCHVGTPLDDSEFVKEGA